MGLICQSICNMLCQQYVVCEQKAIIIAMVTFAQMFHFKQSFAFCNVNVFWKQDSYFNIHITPQEECSYVSFETNVKVVSRAFTLRIADQQSEYFYILWKHKMLLAFDESFQSQFITVKFACPSCVMYTHLYKKFDWLFRPA